MVLEVNQIRAVFDEIVYEVQGKYLGLIKLVVEANPLFTM